MARLLCLLLAGFLQLGRGQENSKTDCHGAMLATICDYGAFNIKGQECIPFKQYAGKYILFITVASY